MPSVNDRLSLCSSSFLTCFFAGGVCQLAWQPATSHIRQISSYARVAASHWLACDSGQVVDTQWYPRISLLIYRSQSSANANGDESSMMLGELPLE